MTATAGHDCPPPYIFTGAPGGFTCGGCGALFDVWQVGEHDDLLPESTLFDTTDELFLNKGAADD